MARSLGRLKPLTATTWMHICLGAPQSRRPSGNCAPRTFADSGIDLNGDSIAPLPALAKTNFVNYHLPNVPYARLYGPRKPKYIEPFANDPAAAKAHWAGPVRGRSSAPKNSAGRRLRERFHAHQDAQTASKLAAVSSAAQTAKQTRTQAPTACFVPIPVSC